MNMHEIMSALSAFFPPSAVSWRCGAVTGSQGKALAYIDARDVMARFDGVMGIDWQVEYTPMPDGTKCCRIGLFINGEWRWRSNGAGDTSVEADKGSYSDAFKRAAVLWGVGRYLYDLPSPWVEIKPGKNGKGGFITDAALRDLADRLDRWHAQQKRKSGRHLEVAS